MGMDPLGLRVEFFDPAFEWFHDTTGWEPTQATVDRVAGFGNGVSLGITGWINRKLGSQVNECSSEYQTWEVVGSLMPIGGGARVASISFIRRPRTVFSHWIPDRYIRPLTRRARKPNPSYKEWIPKWFVNSRFNGNYVSPYFHYLTDPSATMKGMTKAGKLSRPLQQILRVPAWIPEAFVMGAAVENAVDDDCGCN